MTNAGSEVDIILDETPFYAENGGQVGDQGFLRAVATAEDGSAGSSSPSTSGGAEALVSDVQKIAGNFFAHRARITAGEVAVGQQVGAQRQADATPRLGYLLSVKLSLMSRLGISTRHRDVLCTMYTHIPVFLALGFAHCLPKALQRS